MHWRCSMAPRFSSARSPVTEFSVVAAVCGPPNATHASHGFGGHKPPLQMKRILVIRGGAIGDFILTLPALKLLRDAFPNARVEIVGYKHIAALAENQFYADAVRSLEDGRLAGFFAADAELDREWSNYFGSFDLIVSYLFDPDTIFQRNLNRCGVENFVACSPKIFGDEHAAVQLARPLEQLGLVVTDAPAKLYPSVTDRDLAKKDYAGGAAIAIHPGSGSLSKSWPLEHWIALLDRLLMHRMDPSLLVIGGEADTEQLTTLRSALSGRARFIENLALVSLAAVLERCVLFIGHDSGISHMAAAVGTQCILLFGPTDPRVWAPANANVRVVQSCTGAMRGISVDEVAEAVHAAGAIDELTS